MARLYMQELRVVPSMSDYRLNMSDHGSVLLNILENTWINCSAYPRFLNMPWYICNNIIIIVTNIITLEMLSARFAQPGALPPCYIFLARVRTWENES